ncbi:hypothetical protein GGR50DRAFT_93892 [Xylaria sp. CBS 124048]|nr:hypothetical protein GGR50DRAFT_93892 [Xylaria sp. CBS 124048]
MASITRQPFAPLSEARLHSLTSLKNRQNAITNSSPGKRKASDATESYDLENIDPGLSSKRSKGSDSPSSFSKTSFSKPSTFLLAKSASANDLPVSIPGTKATPRSRSLLNPKSPSTKLNTSITQSSPLSAPAGRSPPRGKRTGILSSRRHLGGSFGRVDPPAFGLPSSSSAAPFSLDAALKGTIPSYTSRNDTSFSKKSSSGLSGLSGCGGLHEPEMSSSWFFDIHEDTEEQEMTNLLQHSTCVLDISSDEESESRRQRENVEGKENVPPIDDISQTSRPRAVRFATGADEMMIESERSPLSEMDPKEYYSDGCDENSVVVIHDDQDDEAPAPSNIQPVPEVILETIESEFEPEPIIESSPVKKGKSVSVEKLMQKADSPAPSAAVLTPIEGTGESFEVWESSSAKDETETGAEF